MAAECSAAQGVAGPLDLAETGIRALLGMVPCEPLVREDTPTRVIAAFHEMLAGYDENPADILLRQFPAPGDDLVILKDVEFTSLCEHHLMPFSGQAHIGYVPDGRVVGLSKLARLVDCLSMRLQIQERLCAQIAEAIAVHVSSKGAACVIEASHGCLSCRGARKPRATFITSAMLGVFRDNGELRREFFAAIDHTHSRI